MTKKMMKVTTVTDRNITTIHATRRTRNRATGNR
jgi:hypothetical protein